MSKPLQWIIVSVTVILLCIFSYALADIQAALWFHALNNKSAHDLFSIITLFGDSLCYLIIGVLLFIVFRNTNQFKAYVGLFLFSSVAISGLSADLIKYIAGRTRPTLYFSEHLYGFYFFRMEHAWTSFPSGHSATAFSVAMFLATRYPRWRLAFLFAATLIAVSRVFLTQHYISDVIAGSFIGILSTAFLYNFYFKSKFDASTPKKI